MNRDKVESVSKLLQAHNTVDMKIFLSIMLKYEGEVPIKHIHNRKNTYSVMKDAIVEDALQTLIDYGVVEGLSPQKKAVIFNQEVVQGVYEQLETRPAERKNHSPEKAQRKLAQVFENYAKVLDALAEQERKLVKRIRN